MKKLTILCSSLLISLCISAQKAPVKKTTGKTSPADNFCSTVKKILDNRHNDFRDLYTWGNYENVTDVKNYGVPRVDGIGSSYGYKPKLKIPGAMASFISYKTIGGKYYHTYYAYWGVYYTKKPGTIKTEELKKRLMACLPDYEAIPVPGEKIEAYKNHMFTHVKYEFRNKNPFYIEPKISLLFEKDSASIDQNVIFIVIEGNSFLSKHDLAINKPAIGDPTDNQTKFAKQLQQLLNYAKDGFKTIRGEKIEEPGTERQTRELLGERPHVKYKTTFLPEGADKSELRFYPDSSKFIYLALYGDPLIHQDLFKKQFEKIKKELGDDFTYEANEKSIEWMFDMFVDQKAIFYRKDSKQFLIELKLNTITDIKEGMPRGVWLVVKALNSQSAVSDNKPVTKDIAGNETILKIWQNDKGQGDQAKLVKQLPELLAYSDKNFEAIKGAKLPQDSASKAMGLIEWVETYHTSYALEGAEKNSIKIAGEPRFVASFTETGDTAKASFLFRDIASKIKIALGKDVSSATEEKPLNTTITFKKKGDKTTMYYVGLRWARLPLPLYNFSLEKVGEYISSIISIDVYQKFEY